MFEDHCNADDLKEFLQGFDINLDKDDVGTKADQIAKSIEDSKHIIRKKLEDEFLECSQSVKEANQLYNDVENLCERSGKVRDDIMHELSLAKELSPVEIDSLAFKLERSNKALLLLKYMTSLTKNLLDLQNFISGQHYIEAANSLKAIKKLKESSLASELVNCPNVNKSKHLCNLQEMEEVLQEKLSTKLHEMYAMKIPQFTFKEDRVVKLSFSNQVNASLWWEVLKSMSDLSVLEPKIKKLSNNIMKVFENIVIFGSEATVQGNSLLLESDWSEDERTSEDSTKAVENASRVVDFLGRGLRCGGGENENFCLELLGSFAAEEVVRLLNRKVVKVAVPRSSRNLRDFGELVSHIREWQASAQDFGFIPRDEDLVDVIVGSAEGAFAMKRCEDLVVESRESFKGPLHVTIDVGGDPPKVSEAEERELECLAAFTLEPAFAFPKCQVSASVRKAWDLVEESFLDFSGGHLAGMGEVGLRFCKTVRKVLQLYVSVVPLQHAEEIQNLPLLPAIHHNNCMYLSHQAVLMEARLKAVFSDLPPSSSFMDFVLILRKMAASTLRQFVSRQKEEICKDLNSCSGYENISEVENLNECNKSIDRVLLRLRHLNGVWSDVLPPVFQTLIGFLLNSCSEEIMKSIIRLEDISESDGQHFVSAIAKLEKFGDELFPSSGERLPAFRCIESWTKLKELKFVLNARLLEIRDRWASGKGPLADQFSSEELDHLVRALFQNTDMRAAVLASINNC